jgi:hypothetical protein
MGLVKMQAQELITDSIQKHKQIFSLAPISKKVDKVNGLVFGVGHVDNKNVDFQVINGVNVEANPAPIAGAMLGFAALMYLPDIIKNENKKRNKINVDYFVVKENTSPHLKLNGFNISSGCFFTATDMNGLNISTGNKFNHFNGFSITFLGTIADHQNGLSVGLYNANNDLAGSTIGVYNQSCILKGLQLGLFNKSKINKGLQIGLVNKSNSKGMQLGLWNSNNKRGFPFLNW